MWSHEAKDEDAYETRRLQIDKFDYDINQHDLFIMIHQILYQNGPKSLVEHHLRSANQFYSEGIVYILQHGFRVERKMFSPREHSSDPEEKKIVQVHCKIVPTSIEITKPIIYDSVSSMGSPLMPITALTRDKIYSGQLTLNCDVIATAYLEDGSVHATRTESVKGISICRLPIIKGSKFCHTYDMSKHALLQMGEDPTDPGGYFVIRGEWAIDCVESMPYNWPKIYINEGYDKQRVRCEFISKPGDSYQNSAYMMVIFNNDNTLVIEIYRDKFMEVRIPFFLLFRALGWVCDKKIMDWIIYDYDNDANRALQAHIIDAMQAKYDKINYANIRESVAALTAIVDMIPAEKMSYYDLRNKPENYHNARQEVLQFFDTHFLPHIGMDMDSRDDKLKFTGLLIRKTILVYLGQIPQTDRVSMLNKRINPAGDSYAKAFKSFTNHSVIVPVKRMMNKVFRSQKFENVNLSQIVFSVQDHEFERLMKQSVVGGKGANMKLGANRNIVNRLRSMFLQRKNNINPIATLRQISKPYTDSGIQSSMATEMRKFHGSAANLKCPVHTSPEGESVGINEQMALSAQIVPNTSSQVLKDKIRSDEEFIPGDSLSPLEISRRLLARVYINGELVGYVANAPKFATKCRKKRREGEIHFHTTIYWDAGQDEIYFSVDAGRMARPVLIVYNTHRDAEYFANGGAVGSADDAARNVASHDAARNATRDDAEDVIIEDASEESDDEAAESKGVDGIEDNDDALIASLLPPADPALEYKNRIISQIQRKKKEKVPAPAAVGGNDDFEQGIALTREDIALMYANKKTVMDLVREQKVEFISADEQQNYYMAANFNILRQERKNKYRPFTHCDIPEAMVGITTLTSPFAAHNQPAKLIYQTSQVRQTCGYYCLNWPYRMDKETFLQPVNEMPLVITKANRYVLPNGCNVLMAMMCDTGFNQEDSLIFSKTAIDLGLFGGSKFTFEKVELEQREEMGIPDKTKTEGIKSANYDKLDAEGVVPVGTKLQKDDVIIGMYAALNKPTDRYAYVDESRVYRSDEPAIVQNRIFGQNEEGLKFCKVGLRKVRNPIIGDKFSSRHGQKGICACVMKESDMPYTEDGQKIEVIFNPHGIPSRMTMGQIIEMLVAKICAYKGAHYDATIFKEFDIEVVADELEKFGFQRYGYEKLLNGLTGEYIDSLIFVGPIFYQRLAKLVLDNEYVIKNPATDAATRQPLDNAGINGGLRVGEMEKWCFAAHGASRTWAEKSRDHSDGYVEHICRCGKEAIVNYNNGGYYYCKYCGDNADIFAIPNTWSSKLFRHELQSIGVGPAMLLQPYINEVQDDEDRSRSRIEEYNNDAITEFVTSAEKMIDADAEADN